LRSHVAEIGTLSRWLCVGALRKRVLAALGVDDILTGSFLPSGNQKRF
jgi:hypothetical protein